MSRFYLKVGFGGLAVFDRHDGKHCEGIGRVEGRTPSPKPMLKIEAMEYRAEIVLRLHGRLAGPWVDELESQWRRTQAARGDRRITVDLSGVTGIDGAARYLLQLMRVRNVSLVGASLAIRASLDDETSDTSESG